MYLSCCKNIIIALFCVICMADYMYAKKKHFSQSVYQETRSNYAPEIPLVNNFSQVQNTINNRQSVIIVIAYDRSGDEEYQNIVNAQLQRLSDVSFVNDSGARDVAIMRVNQSSKAGRALKKYYNVDDDSEHDAHRKYYHVLCFYRGALLDTYVIVNKNEAQKLYDIVVAFYSFEKEAKEYCGSDHEDCSKKNIVQDTVCDDLDSNKEPQNKGKGKINCRKSLKYRRNGCKRAEIIRRKESCGDCYTLCDPCGGYSAPRFGISFGMGGVPAWQWPGYFYNRPYWGGFGPWSTVPYWSTSFNWSI